MIAIVDYGVGNLGSILNMFRKIGVEAAVTSEPATIAGAERLVLPGVGSFDHGMQRLRTSGLIPLLTDAVNDGRPLLGICLGMQLLGKGSEEGIEPGLGWIPAESVRFSTDNGVKVPHMGWNDVRAVRSHPLLDNVDLSPRFYFLHSYYLRCTDEADVVATTTYAESFTSVVARANVAGVQFHPEKSHRFGMALLRNFAVL